MIKMPPVQTQYFAFNGGLDQVTPPIQMYNGALRYGSNIEIGIRGGYARAAGYERYSGLTEKPSLAEYAILTCDITGVVVAGDVLTDDTAAAYGTVIALPTGEAVLTKITGFFATGNIKIGATVVGTCTGPQATGGATTAALNAAYTALAANVYRALIGAVPGSGDVLGVHQYNGNVWAVRNNAGGTAAVLHKDSTSGWVAVALGREVAFTSGGTYEILEGDIITGATSGATAAITRAVLSDGDWAAGTAIGTLVFASQTGAFQAENLNVGANLNVATIAGNSTAITLLPDGRYEFENWNFGGQVGTKRMYGCDGVNPGFEFDGTTFVPIHTGMTDDAPKYLRIHKNQLFFAFASSLQHSGIGMPYSFAPIFGAAELACGDTITGMLKLPGSEAGGSMAVYTQNRTLVLYGNDVADWNLVPLSEESGALPYTMQYVRNGITLDSQGITVLNSTQKYGNFQSAVISDKITPYLADKITLAIASCICRKKNQYRLFFSDGEAVFVSYAGDKLQGMTTMRMPHDVTCISSMEGASGQEEIYFGSSDGFVYQHEVGTSFDGQSIQFIADLTFNHFNGPRQLKQFRKAVIEVTGVGYSEFSFSSSLAYGSDEFSTASTASVTASIQSSSWDSFTWDSFFWDGRSLSPSEADLTGTAENVSLLFSGDSDAFLPFTLLSTIIHYTPRRLLR